MRTNSDPNRWALIVIPIAILSSVSAGISHGFRYDSDLPQGAPATANLPSRESLEAAARQFVGALKNGDAGSILQQFSKKGVVFGIDSDPLPWNKIKQQMKKGGDLYCLFFDTQCLRKDPSFQKQSALRDILVGGKSYRMQVAVGEEFHRRTGFVRLFVESNPDRTQEGKEFCDLGYVFEDHAWKISEVQYF